ncbi:YqgE/AlgH family protein [Chitinophaga sp. Cy-1792]|uniref:YqgE/AlgH family protein n=1 Tax=Chitinophaga sp. Cy-1792 TaxID=2608339 RepID=UPI0014241E90|nr:YqgE/AlgH family protein [Chitinophaga sp. Cy-1792]NIG54083.1 YqgE/AlgH family protein [Chitinophaga sp. Cy-1792]
MNEGIFLHSTSLLDDTFFENTVIYITEHNEKGAMGFVVNQPFPRKINELKEFSHSIPFPLYIGGPVDQEHIYFIHQRPDLISGGDPIRDNVYLGGDFKSAIQHINSRELTEKDIKIFIGYCGWDDKELEEEINEGSWEIETAGSAF